MAGKISTLVLKVDLDCHRCHRKIRKVICKLQESENIKTIFYDDKNKSVTISGPFDPEKLSEKIKCKASKVIKDIKIKEDKGGNKTKVDKATQTGVHFPEDVLNAEKEKKLKNDTQKVKPVEDRWPPAAPEPAKAEELLATAGFLLLATAGTSLRLPDMVRRPRPWRVHVLPLWGCVRL